MYKKLLGEEVTESHCHRVGREMPYNRLSQEKLSKEHSHAHKTEK